VVWKRDTRQTHKRKGISRLMSGLYDPAYTRITNCLEYATFYERVTCCASGERFVGASDTLRYCLSFHPYLCFKQAVRMRTNVQYAVGLHCHSSRNCTRTRQPVNAQSPFVTLPKSFFLFTLASFIASARSILERSNTPCNAHISEGADTSSTSATL
jgi:hypothetical protein